MTWNNAQMAAAHIAKNQLGWNEPQYRMILRNVAGIREYHGKVSSKNPTADNAGYVRFMAFCEQSGFVDTKNGQGYWTQEVAKQRQPIHYKITELYERARRHKLFDTENPLPAFIERQTLNRPIENGGQCHSLEECDALASYQVLEGLKKWVYGLAKARGVVMNA